MVVQDSESPMYIRADTAGWVRTWMAQWRFCAGFSLCLNVFCQARQRKDVLWWFESNANLMYLVVGPLKLFVLCIEIFCTNLGCHLKIQNERTINNMRKWTKKLGDKKKRKWSWGDHSSKMQLQSINRIQKVPRLIDKHHLKSNIFNII